MNQLYRIVLLGFVLVCSANLWRLLGNDKQPEEKEVTENNKEETKEGNTRARTERGRATLHCIDSGVMALIFHLIQVK